MISERDTQIASIAMANKLVVVTHNVKEFGRIIYLFNFALIGCMIGARIIYWLGGYYAEN